MNETNTDRVFGVTEEQTKDRAFYTEILGWSEDVWRFDSIAEDGIPELNIL